MKEESLGIKGMFGVKISHTLQENGMSISQERTQQYPVLCTQNIKYPLELSFTKRLIKTNAGLEKIVSI